jgi:hypothetical protein
MLPALRAFFDVHVGFAFIGAVFSVSCLVCVFAGNLKSRIGKFIYALMYLIATASLLIFVLWTIAAPLFWAFDSIWRLVQ